MSAPIPTPTLLSLPRELREQIYLQTFTDVTANHNKYQLRPLEPAISKVNQLTRREVLPLYYALFPLTVQVYVKCDSHGSIRVTANKWYRHLAAAKIQHIRTIILRFGFLERYFGEPVLMQFTIDLRKRYCHRGVQGPTETSMKTTAAGAASGSYALRHSFGAGWFHDKNRKGDPADCEEVLLVLRAQLEKCLDGLMVEPGVGGFEASHVDSLVAVDPDVFP